MGSQRRSESGGRLKPKRPRFIQSENRWQSQAAGVSKAGCKEPEGCRSEEEFLRENGRNAGSDERRQRSADEEGPGS